MRLGKITEIALKTSINAPVERCFDLSLSIDLHQHSVSFTRERAVGGVTAGLIGFGEEVEWQARHLGFWFSMRVRITALERPTHFRDEMVAGPFRGFQHDHSFVQERDSTVMVDRLHFESSFGWLGKAFDKLILKTHLRRLLETRNRAIKSVAESDQWDKYLSFPKS